MTNHPVRYTIYNGVVEEVLHPGPFPSVDGKVPARLHDEYASLWNMQMQVYERSCASKMAAWQEYVDSLTKTVETWQARIKNAQKEMERLT